MATAVSCCMRLHHPWATRAAEQGRPTCNGVASMQARDWVPYKSFYSIAGQHNDRSVMVPNEFIADTDFRQWKTGVYTQM